MKLRQLTYFIKFLFLSGFGVLVFLSGVESAHGVRLKDMASIKGIRTNQLLGYGIVVGLNGTGDKSGTEFTIQSLVNMLERMGVHVEKSKVKVKNVAAVMVSANLPPFARIGSKIDIMMSSIGDASSLVGGTLLLTPLKGVNGKVYAIAQGSVAVGGFSAGGTAGGAVQNHTQVARISRGATVEQEVPVILEDKQSLTLALYNPDFTTAMRVVDAINGKIGHSVARAVDSGTLSLLIPPEFQSAVANFIADIETLEVTPDTVAKIIVNEKTGTVVIGENVRISTVAISHANLSITIRESQEVSQPLPLSEGQTVVTPQTDIQIKEGRGKVILVPKGNTIGELVRALNALGVTPRTLISIFQSIKASGALQAELEII